MKVFTKLIFFTCITGFLALFINHDFRQLKSKTNNVDNMLKSSHIGYSSNNNFISGSDHEGNHEDAY